MPIPAGLSQGDHELTKAALDWEVQVIEPHPTVELLASLESHPVSQPSVPPRGKTATSLAIRMSPEVAMTLYLRLRELGRSMGWLPTTKDASQA
jgi:hypothetical protein